MSPILPSLYAFALVEAEFRLKGLGYRRLLLSPSNDSCQTPSPPTGHRHLKRSLGLVRHAAKKSRPAFAALPNHLLHV